MSEVFSILLHNRQRYEQGKEGLWFSLPTTTEKLTASSPAGNRDRCR